VDGVAEGVGDGEGGLGGLAAVHEDGEGQVTAVAVNQPWEWAAVAELGGAGLAEDGPRPARVLAVPTVTTSRIMVRTLSSTAQGGGW
jgi:hypothetical protein